MIIRWRLETAFVLAYHLLDVLCEGVQVGACAIHCSVQRVGDVLQAAVAVGLECLTLCLWTQAHTVTVTWQTSARLQQTTAVAVAAPAP